MKYAFFLGGNDLEMETIRRVLESQHVEVHDDHLAWGARASHYRDRIRDALDRGLVPVLVELDVDEPLPPKALVVIDHHGDRAGAAKQTSLEQVFGLLAIPESSWTRELELVAANDRGHIDGLLLAGATVSDVVRIRKADRFAQGIDEEQERQAAEAVEHAERLASGLTLVQLPHGRTATVTDALHRATGGPGYDCLAIVSPGEVNVFADGATIARLDREFPGGWKGGALPERGFWGRRGREAQVVEFLRRLRAKP